MARRGLACPRENQAFQHHSLLDSAPAACKCFGFRCSPSSRALGFRPWGSVGAETVALRVTCTTFSACAWAAALRTCGRIFYHQANSHCVSTGPGTFIVQMTSSPR